MILNISKPINLLQLFNEEEVNRICCTLNNYIDEDDSKINIRREIGTIKSLRQTWPMIKIEL